MNNFRIINKVDNPSQYSINQSKSSSTEQVTQFNQNLSQLFKNNYNNSSLNTLYSGSNEEIQRPAKIKNSFMLSVMNFMESNE